MRMILVFLQTIHFIPLFCYHEKITWIRILFFDVWGMYCGCFPLFLIEYEMRLVGILLPPKCISYSIKNFEISGGSVFYGIAVTECYRPFNNFVKILSISLFFHAIFLVCSVSREKDDLSLYFYCPLHYGQTLPSGNFTLIWLSFWEPSPISHVSWWNRDQLARICMPFTCH